MTTTNIQFKEEQDFETIKTVIEKEFTNVNTHRKMSDLEYISFSYKKQIILCWFMKHNTIHGKGNVITECSTFSSDRPNEIKTEAFKIIARYFDCRFWENDCCEDNFIDFKTKEKEVKALSSDATHWLRCRHCIGRSCKEYFMACIPIGKAKNGKLRVLVFGKDIGQVKKVLKE